MTEKPTKKPNAKEMFDYLTSQAMALLIRQGESVSDAEKHAKAFTMRVLEKIGGVQIYIPQNAIQKVIEKRASLRAEFKISRETVVEFALRNDISTVYAYQILKETTAASSRKQAGYRILSDIAIEAARMLVATGVSILDAAPMAKDFTSVMLAKWGGQQVYFPSIKLLSTLKRAADIWKQHQAGHKAGEIASRYGLSEQAVHLIIRERCKESGQVPPGRIRKKHPLILVRRKILQIAEDYKTGDQQAFDKLQKIAGQIDSVRQSLMQKGNYDVDTRTTENK